MLWFWLEIIWIALPACVVNMATFSWNFQLEIEISKNYFSIIWNWLSDLQMLRGSGVRWTSTPAWVARYRIRHKWWMPQLHISVPNFHNEDGLDLSDYSNTQQSRNLARCFQCGYERANWSDRVYRLLNQFRFLGWNVVSFTPAIGGQGVNPHWQFHEINLWRQGNTNLSKYLSNVTNPFSCEMSDQHNSCGRGKRHYEPPWYIAIGIH